MSFVESATLRLIDESSRNLNRINSNVTKLFSNASRLNNLRVNLRVNVTGFQQAQSQIAQLQRMLGSAASSSGLVRSLNNLNKININPSLAANLASLAGAMHQLANAQARLNSVPPPRMPRLPSGGGYGGGGYGGGGYGRQPVNNGYFGRFPENIPGIAARYAAWQSVQVGHNVMRSGGRGYLSGSDQRTIDNLQRLRPGETTQATPYGAAGAPGDRGAMRDDNWRVARAASSKYLSMSDADAVEIARQARPQIDPSKHDRLNEVVEAGGKLQQIATAVFGDAKKGEETAYKIMRVGIATGKIDDPTKFAAMTDEIGRAIIQSGKDVSPTLIESTFRQAGALSKMGLSGQAIGDLVNLSDEERGRAADRIRTFTQDLTRFNLAEGNRTRMEAAGLRVAGGGAVDQSLLASDPYEWIKKHILPNKMLQGVNLDDQGEVVNALQKMGFLNSSSQYAASIIKKRNEIARERHERAQYDTDQAAGLHGTHARTALAAVEKQFQNFSDSVLKTFEPVISGGLGKVAQFLNTQSKNGTAWGAVLGMAGGAAAYAVANPLIPSAIAHMAAAKALMTAAGVLAGRGAIGAGLAKAAAAGLPGAAAAAAATRGGLLGAITGSRGTSWMGAAAQSLGIGAANRAATTGGRAMQWFSRGMLGMTVFDAGKDIYNGQVLDGVQKLGLGLMALTGPVGMIASAGLGIGWALTGSSPLSWVGSFAKWLTGTSAQASEANRQITIAASKAPKTDEVGPVLDNLAKWVSSTVTQASHLRAALDEAAKSETAREANLQAENPRLDGETDYQYRKRLAKERRRIQNAEDLERAKRDAGLLPPAPSDDAAHGADMVTAADIAFAASQAKRKSGKPSLYSAGASRDDTLFGPPAPPVIPDPGASLQQGAEAVRAAGQDAGAAVQNGGTSVAGSIRDALASGASSVAAAIRDALSSGVNVNVNSSPGASTGPQTVTSP